MKRSVFKTFGVTLVAAALFSACGGGGSDSSGPPADADLVVEAFDSLTWGEPEYSAAAGEIKIAVVNKGSIAHTLLVVGADSKQIGEKLSVTGGGEDDGVYNLAAGQYSLFCNVPGHSNMNSVLTVT
jgi:plastocyanin